MARAGRSTRRTRTTSRCAPTTATRLRHLLAPFAKEIVARTYQQPGADALLERMVEVLAYAGITVRNLRAT
jgi:hypothetical protein